MKRTLSVYVNLPDKKLDLPSYLKGRRFVLSLLPIAIERGTFSTEGINEVKQLLEEGCLLGQRGYSGRCRHVHDDKTDPWHENFCPYNKAISYESQLELMMRGREILRETFGLTTILYAPLNHLYDESTFAALQVLGYKYLMDQNNFNIPQHEVLNITVIPETRISKGARRSIGVHAHIDELRNSEVERFISSNELILPTDLEAKKVNRMTLKMNEIKKRANKYARDIRRIIKKE